MSSRSFCLFALGILPATFSALVAQGAPGTPPSATECADAAAALSAGGRLQSAWNLLPSCGTSGASALAAAVSATTSEADTSYLRDLYGVAASIKDPAILAAAGTVVSDPGATQAARVTAILLLVAQFDNAIMARFSVPWGALLTGSYADCPFAVATRYYAGRRQLQADSSQRVASALDQARNDGSAPGAVRALAQCARTVLRGAIPITVSSALIRLTYVCGNRFRVRNSSGEWITVAFDVYQTTDKGELTIGPGADLLFTTREKGTVRLFYGGALVQTKENGASVCSP
jgi:hypothetical protein